MKKTFNLFVILALMAITVSGCYWNKRVEESEMGLKLNDGVSIDEIVPSGRYGESGWFASMQVIDVSAKTASWSDPDLVTKDKQPIGLDVAVTFQRSREDSELRKMWQTYRSEALYDDALIAQVLSRIPGAAKSVTTEYTLDEMLGVSTGNLEASRAIVTQKISDLLGPELAEVGIVLLDVRITNIAVDQGYLDLLKEKAQVSLRSDLAKQQTAQLVEQLKQEEQKTLVELEIAQRQNLINEELSKAYSTSPELFRIKLMELMGNVIGENDKVIFVPPGSDLSIILGQDGIVPVVQPGTGQ